MNELVYILEAAKEHYELSNLWWNSYRETESSSDYAMFMNEHGNVEGLLTAYEILSGRKVFGFTIDEELASIA